MIKLTIEQDKEEHVKGSYKCVFSNTHEHVYGIVTLFNAIKENTGLSDEEIIEMIKDNLDCEEVVHERNM